MGVRKTPIAVPLSQGAWQSSLYGINHVEEDLLVNNTHGPFCILLQDLLTYISAIIA